MGIRIETVSPEEAARYVAKVKGPVREIHLPGGMSIKGSAELTCRDNVTGDVVWKHAADNTITDYGRRHWLAQGITTMYVFTHPSTETPKLQRSSLVGPYDGNAIPLLNVGQANAWPIRTWSGSMTAPGGLRTIGTVGLSSRTPIDFRVGVQSIVSYLLMTPVKTQTTSQTLEFVYKVTFQIATY